MFKGLSVKRELIQSQLLKEGELEARTSGTNISDSPMGSQGADPVGS